MKTVFNNDELCIKSTDALDSITQDIIKAMEEKFTFYRTFFQVDKLEKIEFRIFDDLDEFRKDYQSRCDREPPIYSRGWFDSRNNISTMVLEKIPKKDTPQWIRFINANNHEAFHLFYKHYVYKTSENRIVWFDEGLAQFLSGEYSYLTGEKLRSYYLEFKRNYLPITNLNERIQGNYDVNDELIFFRENVFNGYSASFLSINYLNECFGIDFLRKVMKDKTAILTLGNTILNDMMDYYDSKYEIVNQVII